MKTLSKKTPVRRRLFIQAYAMEGEWDVNPFLVTRAICDGEPCLAKYYGCHRDPEKSECSEGDIKVHFTK